MIKHSEIIAAVIKRLGDPGRYTNKFHAVNKAGLKVEWDNPVASARDLQGEYWYQILLANKKNPEVTELEIIRNKQFTETVHSLIPKCACIEHWEEKATTKHSDVMRVLKRAHDMIKATEDA